MEPSLKFIAEKGGVNWTAISTQEVSVPMNINFTYKLQYQHDLLYLNYLITDSIYIQSPPEFNQVIGEFLQQKSLLVKLIVPLNNEELFYFDKYCTEEIQYRQNHHPHRYADYINPYLKAIELSQSKRSKTNLRKEMDSALAENDKKMALLIELQAEEMALPMAKLQAELQAEKDKVALLTESLQVETESLRGLKVALRELRAEKDKEKGNGAKAEIALGEKQEPVETILSGWTQKDGEQMGRIQLESTFGIDEEMRQERYAKRLVPTEEAKAKVAEKMLKFCIV
jgi:hypothetical protein